MAVVFCFVQGTKASNLFFRTASFVSFDPQLKTLDGPLQICKVPQHAQQLKWEG